MEFNPERLEMARRMRGLTLESLEALIDKIVSKQSLYKYEKGIMNPDDSTLKKLAAALEVTPEYFSRVFDIELEDVSFRKLDSTPSIHQEHIKSLTVDALERYFELEEALGINYQVNRFKKKYKVNEPKDIEKYVMDLRHEWKLGIAPIHNVIEWLEDKGIKVLIVEAHESIDGLSTWVKKDLPVIVLNRINQLRKDSDQEKLDRFRFTALHELGHLVLDLDEFDEKTQEKLCHRFAGAMMMPEVIMNFELGPKRNNLSISELGLIKIQYGISIQAILMRAFDLNIISKRTLSSVYSLIIKKGYKIDEPEEYDYVGSEKSRRYHQLILRAESEGILEEDQLAYFKNYTQS